MKKILISLVVFYQRNISRYTRPHCRFEPTCSNYMIDSLRKHGIFFGLIMGVARIIRCNPFNKTGFDPVPDKFTIFRNKRPYQT
ncbi:membrane protein insertion efficiency factor YidD [Companilactobacillus sp. RD055328]|uniref:membrane protein insertion efficiency factor YidD n=1 Tax=Companilactobacillus sp. RD055328 TaxID=2916634 RepID=UPI001FC7F2F6|nr:membrane protein insertion efficiency factor YidD [Companilactobacillus sp. RD055328]